VFSVNEVPIRRSKVYLFCINSIKLTLLPKKQVGAGDFSHAVAEKKDK